MASGSSLLALAASLLLPDAASAQSPQDESFHAFLQDHFRADREDYPETRYASARADLDGDGRAEALVYLMSGNYCGSGGCNLIVFAPRGSGWREVATISIANPPIRLLATRSRGWRDLGVRVAGGGVARGYEARLSFDGRSYPDNPSGPPARRLGARAPGRVLIAPGDRGRPLF